MPTTTSTRATSRRAPVAAVGVALALGLALSSAVPADAHPRESRKDAWVRSTVRAMTLEQKVGQLFVPYVNGASADTSAPENLERFGVATPAEAVQRLHLGGVIYFAWSGNTVDPQQVAALSNGLQEAALAPAAGGSAASRVPLTIATDQETGLVARIGPPATQFPGAMALGAGGRTSATRDTYEVTGRELKAMGIGTDYAPVADVNVNPANPVIGVRSFSSDPTLVSRHVGAAVRGLQDDADVSAVAKHFPGHGDTATDSHTALPVITHTREEWERLDAPPFRAAIAAGVDSIMTAHISFPALEPSGDPSTLSRAVLTGLLREELGFTGVIATDSLRMEGVRTLYSDAEIPVRALEAGADVLLDPQQPALQVQAVIDAVRSGRLSERRIEQSVARILAMKWERGVVAHPTTSQRAVERTVGTRAHLALAQRITDRTATLLVDDAGLVPLPAGDLLVTGAGASAVPQLAEDLTQRGHPATALVTGTSPSDAAVAGAVAAADGKRAVVVATSGAWTNAAQQRLVARLQATGVPVLVVATGVPYDIAALPGTRSYLATYSATPVAIRSLARLLDGDVRARGRLPVQITDRDDPSTVLYPLGAGIAS